MSAINNQLKSETSFQADLYASFNAVVKETNTVVSMLDMIKALVLWPIKVKIVFL